MPEDKRPPRDDEGAQESADIADAGATDADETEPDDSTKLGTETMLFTALVDPDAGRRRLWHAVRHPAREQVAVAIILAALGFAATIQLRDTADESSYSGLRESELIVVLDGLTGTAEQVRAEIARLEETRADLLTESSARGAALNEATQREQSLNILAGLVKVTGPGLRVAITPGAGPVSVGALLDTVQELRTAGAEAIEFNDSVRVVAQSSFDSSEVGIELDGVLLRPPFVIDVIGDPHVLRTALNFSDGPIEILETVDGATVAVEEVSSVSVDSVTEPARMPNTRSDEGG